MPTVEPKVVFFPVQQGGRPVPGLEDWWCRVVDQTLGYGRKDDWSTILFVAWGEPTPEFEDCERAALEYDKTNPFPGAAPLPWWGEWEVDP